MDDDELCRTELRSPISSTVSVVGDMDGNADEVWVWVHDELLVLQLHQLAPSRREGGSE